MSKVRPIRATKVARFVVTAAVAALVFAVCYGMPSLVIHNAAALAIVRALPRRGAHQLQYGVKPGPELQLVYVGKLNCAPSNHPALPALLDSARNRVAHFAQANAMGFATLGVALDWRTTDGLAHLARYGEFSELSVGRNWYNAAAQEYIWNEMPGPAATPQLLLVRRDMQRPSAGPADRRLAVKRATVLLRLVGVDEIAFWIRRGAPMPLAKTDQTAMVRYE